MKWVLLGWLLCLCLQPVCAQPAWESTMSPYEQQNLRTNRQWISLRRQHGEAAGARVGVLAGAGVWHLGARSLVTALERAGVGCRVLDPTGLGDLSHFSALILPGGYARGGICFPGWFAIRGWNIRTRWRSSMVSLMARWRDWLSIPTMGR